MTERQMRRWIARASAKAMLARMEDAQTDDPMFQGSVSVYFGETLRAKLDGRWRWPWTARIAEWVRDRLGIEQ